MCAMRVAKLSGSCAAKKNRDEVKTISKTRDLSGISLSVLAICRWTFPQVATTTAISEKWNRQTAGTTMPQLPVKRLIWNCNAEIVFFSSIMNQKDKFTNECTINKACTLILTIQTVVMLLLVAKLLTLFVYNSKFLILCQRISFFFFKLLSLEMRQQNFSIARFVKRSRRMILLWCEVTLWIIGKKRNARKVTCAPSVPVQVNSYKWGQNLQSLSCIYS